MRVPKYKSQFSTEPNLSHKSAAQSRSSGCFSRLVSLKAGFSDHKNRASITSLSFSIVHCFGFNEVFL